MLENRPHLKLKNNATSFSDIFQSEQNWASYGVFVKSDDAHTMPGCRTPFSFCLCISFKLNPALNLYLSLTGEDRLRIERVQKCALSIILGENYASYKSALKQLKLETLFSRRQTLCKKFAKKSLKHAKFSKWFKPNRKVIVTRQNPQKFCELIVRTDRRAL